MAQFALVGTTDGRRPRLGRPVGTSHTQSAVGGVVLLLPDGEASSARGPSVLAHAAALPLGQIGRASCRERV